MSGGEGLAAVEAWREDRRTGWYEDIGYALQDVLREHRYAIERGGGKPDDPGWHECTCGWEGYWTNFQPHVADHLRAVTAARLAEMAADLHETEVRLHAARSALAAVREVNASGGIQAEGGAGRAETALSRPNGSDRDSGTTDGKNGAQGESS